MHDSITNGGAGNPRRTQLELAALRRDVDVKAAYNESLERMLQRLQEAEVWLRGEVTRSSEALVAAQADARTERQSADHLRALVSRQHVEIEALLARIPALDADIAALHVRLAQAEHATAEVTSLLEFERGLVGNRIARRVVNLLQRFPRTLSVIQRVLKRVVGPA